MNPLKHIEAWMKARRSPDRRRDASDIPKTAEVPSERWPLSLRILSWNERDHYLLRDGYCGHLILGSTGSGKSSGPMMTLNREYLKLGAGALFLTCKGTDPQEYYRLACECGREKDVIWLGPGHETSFNFMAELAKGGAGMVANVTHLLSIVSSMASGVSAQGDREGGKYWVEQDNRGISASALLLTLAGEALTTRNLERVILSVPTSREQVADERWQRDSFLWHCLQRAQQRCVTADEREDFERIAEYFLTSMAGLNDRTRSTVLSSIGATLDIFNQPLVRRLISSSSPTFDFAQLQEGKILIVDYPVLVGMQQARIVQMVLKHCFQMCQNRRTCASDTRPVVLACDETQYLCDLEQDGKFLTTARSSCTVVIYATQSISNFLSMNSGSNADARTHAMLANLQNIFVTQTTDVRTIEHLQSLLGKRKTFYMNASTQKQAADWVAEAIGLGSNSSVNSGLSEQLAPLLEAEAFHHLAKGGPEFNNTVEAIVYQGGKRFAATGMPFLIVSFQQSPSPG